MEQNEEVPVWHTFPYRPTSSTIIMRRGVPKGHKGIPPKSILDLTTDAECVADLVNVSMCLKLFLKGRKMNQLYVKDFTDKILPINNLEGTWKSTA